MAKITEQFVFESAWYENGGDYDFKAEQKKESVWLDALKRDLRMARNADSGRGNFKQSLVGEELGWQRGDGFARYIVTHDRPFTVAHLHIGDGYQVEPETIRGLRLKDAKLQIKQRKEIRAIFS